MGIESLNSAVAAAGFAMVSDEISDETDSVYEASRATLGEELTAPAADHRNFLPAVIESDHRPSAASIGARVSGLLEAWRSKG